MPKRPNEQSGQRPNSRLRVLFVELEGADATIEEALRTVERIRRSAEIVQQPVKRIASSANTADTQGALDESVPPDSAQTAEDQASHDDGEAEQAPLESSAGPKRGQGPKRDRNAGIQLIGNLDFLPKGNPALKTYFAEKAPTSDMDQVLVLCHYLQHVLELPAFGPGHILSGFKHVEKPVPVDLRQTIRNVKKEKAWVNFTDIENIRMTTEGDNRVEHQLGKNGSKDRNGSN
jgi:hypothetical protein